jgi:uroporphyrin-3 C-methyltransferase
MENTQNTQSTSLLSELPAPASVESVTPTNVRRSPPWLGVVVGLLFLLLLGVWWNTHESIAMLRDETARQLVASADHFQVELNAVQTDHDAQVVLQEKVDLLETKLIAAQTQTAALDAMYQDILRGRDERLLVEIEQSIALAAQQLQLAGNVDAALIALQAADARLGGSVHSRLLPVRRLILRDIDRLKALPTADLAGLSLKIDSVVAVVDSLPLAYLQRPDPAAKATARPTPTLRPAPPTSTFSTSMLEKFGKDLWQELQQLIRIERINRDDPALLAPSQTYFLRENLRLRLLSARLALLQRQSVPYKADLQLVQTMLEQYFDTESKPVQTVLATMTRLAATNPAPDLPSLNETLTAVRGVKMPNLAGR